MHFIRTATHSFLVRSGVVVARAVNRSLVDPMYSRDAPAWGAYLPQAGVTEPATWGFVGADDDRGTVEQVLVAAVLDNSPELLPDPQVTP